MFTLVHRMKTATGSHMCTALLFLVMALPLFAHTQAASASLTSAGVASSLSKGLFESEEVLEITLTGKIRELINDRFENSPYRPIVLRHKTDTGLIAIPIKVKTRGHFRKLKGNCTYPPLLLNIQKTEALKSPIFREQDKIKLVMPCQGAEFVVREWLVYKLYNLITPKSFATPKILLLDYNSHIPGASANLTTRRNLNR